MINEAWIKTKSQELDIPFFPYFKCLCPGDNGAHLGRIGGCQRLLAGGQ